MKNQRYDSEKEAVQAWSLKYRGKSAVHEWVVLVYEQTGKEKRTYSLGGTFKGMGRWRRLRPNVVVPFVYLYVVETLKQRLFYGNRLVAMVHTHPQPPAGMTDAGHSREDLMLLRWPGIKRVYVIPHENQAILCAGCGEGESWSKK